jgi:hypothetical protein
MYDQWRSRTLSRHREVLGITSRTSDEPNASILIKFGERYWGQVMLNVTVIDNPVIRTGRKLMVVYV